MVLDNLKEHNGAGLLMTKNKCYYFSPDAYEIDGHRFEDNLQQHG